jgi:hypothetical protein
MPTHSEALLEAYAACRPSARVFHTLEIWQSSFDEPARIVANVGDDVFFGIEPGAPHDGGTLVQFTACPLTSDYPEQRAGQAPTSKIKIDNVNRELVPKIRAALGVREYIQILYREYLLSDVTEPAYGPVEFELREVQMVGATLTGTAMVRNLQNRRFPRLNKNYDYIQFPSLLPT